MKNQVLGGFHSREAKGASIRKEGKVGVKDLGDIWSGGSVPSDFPKKHLDFGRDKRNQITYYYCKYIFLIPFFKQFEKEKYKLA